MDGISLRAMDRALLHEYYKGFERDPEIFADMSLLRDYRYSPEGVDAYFDRLAAQKDRKDFLILLDGRPIGEIALKHMDAKEKRCELSVHLQNDSVKNRGIGTRAERLMLDYAFKTLGMETVTADTVPKNGRSRHILQKLGFRETGRDDTFIFYELSRADWLKNAPDGSASSL